MILPGVDGVDHINIYSNGKTELGRWMSNFAHTPFTLPSFGYFASVEALWYYLGNHDDRMRNLSGIQAKRVGQSIVRTHRLSEAAFRHIIFEALHAKLMKNNRMLRLLRDSTLPFAHYYVFGGQRVNANYDWLVRKWEDMRFHLQDNVE